MWISTLTNWSPDFELYFPLFHMCANRYISKYIFYIFFTSFRVPLLFVFDLRTFHFTSTNIFLVSVLLQCTAHQYDRFCPCFIFHANTTVLLYMFIHRFTGPQNPSAHTILVSYTLQEPHVVEPHKLRAILSPVISGISLQNSCNCRVQYIP